VGNFDVSAVNGNITFQNSGTWYNYLTGEPITASGGSQNFALAPGEYKLFVNKNVVNAVVTGINDIIFDPNKLELLVYPNPVSSSSQIAFSIPSTSEITLRLNDIQGKTIAVRRLGTRAKGRHQVNVGTLHPGIMRSNRGVYTLTLSTSNGSVTRRIIL
jgi:hypothetical protein